MAFEQKPLEILAKRMFPSFVAEEYPQMITFTEKVFESMSQEGEGYDVVQHLLDYTNVDTTLTKFETAFKTQYLANFPDALASDVALLVKNVRSFYLNKGTEESFRFLFGALFNSTVNFRYPKFNILRASDGLYFTPEYLVLADTNDIIPPQLTLGGDYNITKLIDKFITGARTGAVGFVENAITLSTEGLTYGNLGSIKAIAVVEKEGTFEAGESILIGDTLVENGSFANGLNYWDVYPESDPDITSLVGEARLVQTTGDIKPKYISQEITVQPGKSYWLRYAVKDSDAVESRVSVGYAPGAIPAELHNSGNLGIGASIPAPVLVGPVAAGKTKIYITLWNEMTVQDQYVDFDGVSLVEEDTSTTPLLRIANIVKETFTDLEFIDSNPDTITTAIADFTSRFNDGDTVQVTGSVSNDGNFATATIAANTITLQGGEALVNEGSQDVTATLSKVESGIIQGTPQWKDVRGFLSEGDTDNDREIVLQDGYFYQDFSYQLTSQVSTDRFESIVRDLVHPAGFIMFGRVVEPDTLLAFGLRSVNYDDLTFSAGAPEITTAGGGRPFDTMWRQGDTIRIFGTGLNSTLNQDGQYVVDTVSGTTITLRAPFNIQAANYAGEVVQISSGMGVLELGTEGLDYSFDTTFVFPLKFSAGTEIDIDMTQNFGFGKTWAIAELKREPAGVLADDWGALLIGDFDSKATSRFGYIDSAEITTTP